MVIFDNDIPNNCFGLMGEMTAWPMGKMGVHTPTAEGITFRRQG